MELRRHFGTFLKMYMEIKYTIKRKDNNEKKGSKHAKVRRIEPMTNRLRQIVTKKGYGLTLKPTRYGE